jgi:hypothetical protein
MRDTAHVVKRDSATLMQDPLGCVEEEKKEQERMSLVQMQPICRPSQPHNSQVACTWALLTQEDGDVVA